MTRKFDLCKLILKDVIVRESLFIPFLSPYYEEQQKFLNRPLGLRDEIFPSLPDRVPPCDVIGSGSLKKLEQDILVDVCPRMVSLWISVLTLFRL